MRCCVDDEGCWPFGAVLRRKASNRLMLRWLKTVVVSDEEKAPCEASGGDREGERKRIVADVSKPQQVTSKPGRGRGSGMSLAGVRLLARRCPACRRRESDLRRSRGTGEGVPPVVVRWRTGS
jgi:hypothetical protein